MFFESELVAPPLPLDAKAGAAFNNCSICENSFLKKISTIYMTLTTSFNCYILLS